MTGHEITLLFIRIWTFSSKHIQFQIAAQRMWSRHNSSCPLIGTHCRLDLDLELRIAEFQAEFTSDDSNFFKESDRSGKLQGNVLVRSCLLESSASGHSIHVLHDPRQIEP